MSPTLLLFLLLLLPYSSLSHAGPTFSSETMRPSGGEDEEIIMDLGGDIRRRRLGGFQVCALCTCCGGPKGLCLPSPCCYAINCNIPNRPFGFCSFTPKACNCLGCTL